MEGAGGKAKQPDPRSEMLKQMLLQLQEWMKTIPNELHFMKTSTMLHHQTAVGVWLTQLEQFGMMVKTSGAKGTDEAMVRITSLAQEVQAIGDRLNEEIDLRIPPRGTL
jgi:hypothetical protein